MSSCQKDVKCQIVKHLDYAGGLQKKKEKTCWGSQILTSILTSDMKVIKIAQKYFLRTFWGFWWPSCVMSKLTSTCVNLNVSINFFGNFLHNLGIWFFDIWHLFDNLTSFDFLTHYLNHLSSSQLEVKGYMWHVTTACMLLNNAYEQFSINV